MGSVSFEDSKVITMIDAKCPRCGQLKIPEGLFFSGNIQVPLKLRVLFFMVNLGINVELNYCPKCGFLRIKLAKA